MTKKVRRIRYRRIPLIRPYVYLVKPKPITQHTSETQIESMTQAEPEQSAELTAAEPPLTVNAEEPQVENASDNHEKPAQSPDTVASFDVEQNPYAHLVSQLPYILSAIPNLVNDAKSASDAGSGGKETEASAESPPDKSNDNKADPVSRIKALPEESAKENGIQPIASKGQGEAKVTRQAQRERDATKSAGQSKVDRSPRPAVAESDQGKPDPAPGWIAWKSPQAEINKQPVSWLQQKKINTRFLWPGLPEQSCRQVRFGGRKMYPDPAMSCEQTNPNFLYNQLNNLASKNQCSLTKLLLLISPVAGVRRFLANSQVAEVSKPCLTMPATSFNSLTLVHYLEHAIGSGYLIPATNYLECVLSQMTGDAELNLPINQLPTHLNEVGGTSALFRLTKAKQSTYVEVIADQVQVYTPGHKAELWSLSNFTELLTLHSSPEETVIAQHFCKPSALTDDLERLLSQGKQQWQSHWQRNFYEFVNSPDPSIEATKLC